MSESRAEPSNTVPADGAETGEAWQQRINDSGAILFSAETLERDRPIEALSRLLLDLYHAAATYTIGDFDRHTFSLIREHIPCDGAWLGRSTVTAAGPRLATNYLFNFPENFIDEWLRVSDFDPTLKLNLRSAGRAIAFGTDDPEVPPEYRAFRRRFGIGIAMVVAYVHPVVKTATHLSLYRWQAEPRFDSFEKELLEQFVPHLVAASAINQMQFIHSRREAGRHEHCSAAICARNGLIQFAEAHFGELMLIEWPDWTGGAVPGALAAALARDPKGAYLGRAVAFEFEPAGEAVLLTAQRRSAIDTLTPREMAVARLFGSGQSYKTVAKTLGLSPATVRHHLRQAYAKLNVQTKTEIVRLISAADQN